MCVLRSSGKRGSSGALSGVPIRATLPYINVDIPVLVVFRALGFVADKDILEHVVFDFEDTELMEALRPSLEEAEPIKDMTIALDYIGKRGAAVGVTKDKRIMYARELLEKHFLPHIGINSLEEDATKKGYFLGPL